MAISRREDVNPKRGVSEYGNVRFADEKNKKYPIDTEEHIRAAWNYINKSKNAGKYSAEEVATIKRKIVAAWKDKIDKAGPPSAEGKSGAMISAANKRKMQQIHDTACELGAECNNDDEDDEVPSAKSIVEAFSAIKCLQGMDYAASEGWDISDAASALAQVAHIASHEASNNEADDVAQLADVMRELLKFVASEIDEMEEAMSNVEEPEQPAYSAMPMAKSARFTEKPLTLTYIKSLHPSHTEQWFCDVLAVKSIGADDIRGYSMLWGDPQIINTDVELEYFTQKSNFWDETLATPKPLTWDHAVDRSFKATPVIGSIVEFGDDEIGRWYNAQLKKNHLYRAAVEQLIQQRALGTSSDSAPQYVVREATGKSTWLKQWPWFASALTTTPAEPRMLDIGSPYWKSIGVARFVQTPDGVRLDSQIEMLERRQRELELYLA